MIPRILITASTAVLLLSSPMPSQAPAIAGGLDFLHEKVLIGGHLCMKDHSHLGKGGDLLQSNAMAKAARDWSEFTALEYGPAWNNFAIAAQKQMSCGQLRGTWMCEVNAWPCRM